MRIKINSIKNRILSGFLSITLFTILLSMVSFYYLSKINNIRELDRRISQIEVLSLNLFKRDNDFFDLEAINKQYFLTKESVILADRDITNAKIHAQLFVVQKEIEKTFKMGEDLLLIQKLLSDYNKKFSLLEEKIYERGFKDYGLEGKMRKYAHTLEEYQPDISLADVLSLRRHEKDFFLRNDTVYVNKHNVLSDKIIHELQQSNSPDTLPIIVKQYVTAFNDIVNIQKEIGINSGQEGLRYELTQLSLRLGKEFAIISSNSDIKASEIEKKGLYTFVLTVLISITFSLLFSYYIATRLSNPIKKLSVVMDKVIANEFKGNIKFKVESPTSEIENLSSSFATLLRTAKSQMQEIKEKSSQLQQQNRELKKLNDELDSFIYSTAHDLRSPLSSVLGLIHLSKHDLKQKDISEYLNLMERSIKKMEEFIRDVVSYSKNNKLDLLIEPVDLRALIEETLAEHQFIKSYDLIEKSIEIEGKEIIYSDKNRLKIVFNNLVSNAVRYADLNKPIPYIHIHLNTMGEQTTLRFSDNGKGIAPHHLSKIFNMFYRATEDSSGSGLGLFIVKETVRKLKGKVKVDSILNGGTSFTFTFPNKHESVIYEIGENVELVE